MYYYIMQKCPVHDHMSDRRQGELAEKSILVALYGFDGKAEFFGSFYHSCGVGALLIGACDFSYFGYRHFQTVLLAYCCKAGCSAVGYVVLFYAVKFHSAFPFSLMSSRVSVRTLSHLRRFSYSDGSFSEFSIFCQSI